MGTDSVPALLPARMLNEYVYCPRLFYLEWVDSRWAPNEDTEAGRFVHRATDRPGRALPGPDSVDLPGRTTSVQLESERLGLVAVVDRVEQAGGTVAPVDTKRGRPGPDGGPWPADRIQVLAQASLLRDAGYRVDEGVIYHAATNQRVTVEVTPSALEEVQHTVRAARDVADQLEPPLPLVDSPKCPRCSLNGLCLPDEVNALLERSERPPRRIVPRDPDRRPVYVTEQGTYVRIKGGRLQVRREDETLADARLIDVSQLCVFGHVQVTTEALTRLWAAGVPTLWFSYGGWLRGWAQGEPSRYVELRRRQVLVHAQGGLGIARDLVAGKIHNARTLLRRNARSDVSEAVRILGNLRRQAAECGSLPGLLGVEGTAARVYFGAFTSMVAPSALELTERFDVLGRARRPPPDPLNCLLSFAYSLLLKDLVATCLAVGLDPYLGVMHQPRFGRPSLALDLAEEFRPLVADSVVLGLLNNGEVHPSDFIVRGRGVGLTANGRRKVIRAYERRLDTKIRHPVFGYQASYRRVLDIQARILAAVMIGELDEYVPMMTR